MTVFSNTASIVKDYKISENAFLPRIVTVPVSQESDVKCSPIVGKGDVVREGDVIAVPKPGGFSAKIHSPVPGTVLGFVSAFGSNGKPSLAVKIKMNGSFSYTGKKRRPVDWGGLSPDALTEKISEKGIINTFYISNIKSLATQIRDVSRNEKKSLVVRLFDEDPVRITDAIVARLYFGAVVKGARIIAKALDADGILFVSNVGSDLNVRKKGSEKDKGVEFLENERFMEVPAKRCLAGNKKEICASFNKTFRKDVNFSVSESDLFLDSPTAYDVWQAVENDVPAINRLVHFSGNCLSSSCLLNVKVGISLNDVVKQIGGFVKEPALIVINGHLTGYSVESLDVPIAKYVKSVCFLSRKMVPDQFMYSCVSCGNCRASCPRKLSPDLLYLYKAEGKAVAEEYVKSSVLCAECGLCNTVCPARLPLSQVMVSIKHSEEMML